MARDTWNRFAHLDPSMRVAALQPRRNVLSSAGRYVAAAVLWGAGAMVLLLGALGTLVNLVWLGSKDPRAADIAYWVVAALLLGFGRALLWAASAVRRQKG